MARLHFPDPVLRLAANGNGSIRRRFSHGGVSMQEMFVPMVVLQVKEAAKDLIEMQFSSAPKRLLKVRRWSSGSMINYSGKTGIEGQEIPITLETSYSRDPEKFTTPSRTVYLSPWSHKEVIFRFTPLQEEALPNERTAGQLTRWFTVAVTYKEGGGKSGGLFPRRNLSSD